MAATSDEPRIPVCVLPQSWRRCFPYEPPLFNQMQSECFNTAFRADSSIIIASPTGSGKTAVLELALVRYFMNSSPQAPCHRRLAVYMAPLKSLCRERVLDWRGKFGQQSLNVVELTGDSSDETDEQVVAAADCIVTTPEKWDAFSRFRREAQGVVGRVGLLMIDEIHQLHDSLRGPTLEAVTARMMTISQGAEVKDMPVASLRILAASATIANVEDLQAWLSSGPNGCVVKQFDHKYRPVPLMWRVLTYPMQATYLFDKALIAKLPNVIREFSGGRPVLVFCNSRKVCQEAAKQLSGSLRLIQHQSHHDHLARAATRLNDKALAAMVRVGIAFHDSSLELDDRRAIEGLFAEAALPVLACTSGLAQGVNLPARLVVVMNTSKYSSSIGGYEEYTRIETMQMAGRAGRPQFDDQGVCVVMTRQEVKARYERMFAGTETIESHMHEHQIAHLNAEIAQRGNYMSDITVCLRWLKSTFLFTRIRRNPSHYKLSGHLDEATVEAYLKRLLLSNLDRLSKSGMIAMSDDGLGVQPKPLGSIMARYCVDFETVAAFQTLENNAGLEAVIHLLANSAEFKTLYLRHAEKKPLFSINESRAIRFPLMDGKKKSKVKTTAMKASLLLQLRAGGHALPSEFHSAEYVIEQSGTRITNALCEYLVQQERAAGALHAALVLRRSLQRSVGWHDDPLAGLRQLEGVGPTLAQKLKDSGIGSLQAMGMTPPSTIERACGKHHPFGSSCMHGARKLLECIPTLQATVGQVAKRDDEIPVTVRLMRKHDESSQKALASGGESQQRKALAATWTLLLSDEHQKLLLIRRITQVQIEQRNELCYDVLVPPQSASASLTATLVHPHAFGLDTRLTIQMPFATVASSLKSPLTIDSAKSATAAVARPRAATPKRDNGKALAGKLLGDRTSRHGIGERRALSPSPSIHFSGATGRQMPIDLIQAACESSEDEDEGCTPFPSNLAKCEADEDAALFGEIPGNARLTDQCKSGRPLQSSHASEGCMRTPHVDPAASQTPTLPPQVHGQGNYGGETRKPIQGSSSAAELDGTLQEPKNAAPNDAFFGQFRAPLKPARGLRVPPSVQPKAATRNGAHALSSSSGGISLSGLISSSSSKLPSSTSPMSSLSFREANSSRTALAPKKTTFHEGNSTTSTDFSGGIQAKITSLPPTPVRRLPVEPLPRQWQIAASSPRPPKVAEAPTSMMANGHHCGGSLQSTTSCYREAAISGAERVGRRNDAHTPSSLRASSAPSCASRPARAMYVDADLLMGLQLPSPTGPCFDPPSCQHQDLPSHVPQGSHNAMLAPHQPRSTLSVPQQSTCLSMLNDGSTWRDRENLQSTTRCEHTTLESVPGQSASRESQIHAGVQAGSLNYGPASVHEQSTEVSPRLSTMVSQVPYGPSCSTTTAATTMGFSLPRRVDKENAILANPCYRRPTSASRTTTQATHVHVAAQVTVGQQAKCQGSTQLLSCVDHWLDAIEPGHERKGTKRSLPPKLAVLGSAEGSKAPRSMVNFRGGAQR